MLVVDPTTGGVVGAVRRADHERLVVAGEIQRVIPGREDDFAWARTPGRAAKEGVPDRGLVPTYRPLAGASQNNRGNSAIYEIAGIGVESTTIKTIAQSNRNAGDDAEMITVMLGVQWPQRDGAIASDGIAVTALLKWGVGNASFEAEIDWNNGTIFSLPASFINVNGKVVESAGEVPDTPLILSAALAYGTVSQSRSSPMRYTDSFYLEGVGEARTIPSFATSFGIVTASSSPDITISMPDAVSPSSSVYRFLSNSESIESQYMIPNGITKMVLTNNNSGNLAVSIVYNLAL